MSIGLQCLRYATLNGSFPSSPAIILPTGTGGTISAAFTANTIAGGPYNVTLASNGVSSPPSFSLTNNPGPPSTITITAGNNQMVGIGTAFAPLQIIVKDSFGNPEGAGVNVTFTAPAAGASGKFANNTNA